LVAAYFSVREEWDDARLSDGHKAAVRRAVFSPDGRLLVSGEHDRSVHIYTRRRTLWGHQIN
jgi:WD40 repeat protein